MKRPFDTILDINLKSLEKVKNDFIFTFNQTDKILVWVAGFSLTAIGLIVSNLLTLKENYTTKVIQYILILLAISIISGIIYRLSALLFLSKFQRILYFLEGAFSKHRIMPTETKKISNPNDIFEIYQRIKNDYNEDYDEVVKLYNQTNDTNSKSYYIKYLNSEYERLAEWSLNEYEFSMDYIKDIMQKAFKLKDKKFEKLLNTNNEAEHLKIWRRVSAISLLITLLSFITVIIILATNYSYN